MITAGLVIREARQDPRWAENIRAIAFNYGGVDDVMEEAVEVALPIILTHLTRQIEALLEELSARESPVVGGYALAAAAILALLAQEPPQ